MIIFNVDLDNTLIYSYKHDIGTAKSCVEIYQGREISFMTDRTRELLSKISQHMLIVPTTTRTEEQYRRINLGMGDFPYALTCNGGVLLVDGIWDEEWYSYSLSMISQSKGEMEKAERILERDPDRCLEVRNIHNLFLFTKSGCPEKSTEELTRCLDTSRVDILSNGAKVYVVPKKLSKATAAARLRERLQGKLVIAAGDSVFDRPMLEYADISLAPEGLEVVKGKKGGLITIERKKLFSEGLLEYLSELY